MIRVHRAARRVLRPHGAADPPQSRAEGLSTIATTKLERSFGWYDFTLRVDSDPAFRRQVAGHLESGGDSVTDPLLGR